MDQDEKLDAAKDAATRWTSFGNDTGFRQALGEVWIIVRLHMREVVADLLKAQSAHTGGVVDDALIDRRYAFAEGKLNRPIDQAWFDRLTENGARIAEQATTFHAVIAGMMAAQQRIHNLLFQADIAPDQLRRMTWATQQLAQIEIEIIVTEMTSVAERRAREALRAQTAMFRDEVAGSIEIASSATREVRLRAEEVTRNAAGMLNRSIEAAAAAEQSAGAMNDAAETAGGLIHAIESTRQEVERSSTVVDRAMEEMTAVVEVSRSLTDHAEAIESVIALIRHVASQTNLLALNATIEAARAGDAGVASASWHRRSKHLPDRPPPQRMRLRDRLLPCRAPRASAQPPTLRSGKPLIKSEFAPRAYLKRWKIRLVR